MKIDEKAYHAAGEYVRQFQQKYHGMRPGLGAILEAYEAAKPKEQPDDISLFTQLENGACHEAQDSSFVTGFNEAKRQALAIASNHESAIYEDVYEQCQELISPHIIEMPFGSACGKSSLTASVVGSLGFLIEHWLATRDNKRESIEHPLIDSLTGIYSWCKETNELRFVSPSLESLQSPTSKSGEE